jgi:hypothetical protein
VLGDQHLRCRRATAGNVTGESDDRIALSHGVVSSRNQRILIHGESPGANVRFYRMAGEPGPAPAPFPVAVLGWRGELMRVQPPGMPHLVSDVVDGAREVFSGMPRTRPVGGSPGPGSAMTT